MKYLLIILLVFSMCAKKQLKKSSLNYTSVNYTEQTPVKKQITPVEEDDFFQFKKELSQIIYFSFDSEKIEDISALKSIIDFAHKYPDKEIILTGGCCPIGEWEYNRRLGLLRGNAVFNYLRPFIKNEMYVSTVGEDELETENESEYWLNRRCEVEIK